MRYVWMQIRPDTLRFSVVAQDSLIYVKKAFDIPILISAPFLNSSSDLILDLKHSYSPLIIILLRLSSSFFEFDQGFFTRLNFVLFSATIFFTTFATRFILRSTFISVVTLAVVLTRGRMIQESYFFSEVNLATSLFSGFFCFFCHYIRTRFSGSFYLSSLFLILFSTCGDLYFQWGAVIFLSFLCLAFLFRKSVPIENSAFDIKPSRFYSDGLKNLSTFRVGIICSLGLIFAGQIIFNPEPWWQLFKVSPVSVSKFERSLYDLHFFISIVLLLIFYIFKLRLLYNARTIALVLTFLTIWWPISLYIISTGTFRSELGFHFRIVEPLILALSCGMAVEKLLLHTKNGLVFIKG